MIRRFTIILPLGLLLGIISWSMGKPNQQGESLEVLMERAIPEQGSVKPLVKRKLLVFSRTNGFRHASIEFGQKMFARLGEKTGAYEAVLSEDIKHFEPDKIEEYDGICFLNTTMEVFSPAAKEWKMMDEVARREAKTREARLKKSLMDHIRSGKGFIGIHAAADTFYEFPEYGEMLGAYFDGHPWNAKTQVHVRVSPENQSHPLVAMVNGEGWQFNEEIYQFKEPYDSQKVTMLLRLDTEKTKVKIAGVKRQDQDFGISWIKRHGKGRVFYCSLGHNQEIFVHPEIVLHYLAGIQWALGDKKIEESVR